MLNVQLYLMPLVGGILIGLSALILMMSIGRITGISGISSGLLKTNPEGGKLWRITFIVGLVLGAFLLDIFTHNQQVSTDALSFPVIIASGLLVGFGSHLGSGCTSGHGVCGIGRLSMRSIIATCLFMFSGAITVFIIRHIIGQ
ncbi:YeeE/YedE family protein [Pseudoalteromonas sp. C2R02]|uniref:YeeE/YedE family protein n=1 Tax=Pseudoalteromonas sp. C2R02 TaxID=2841565 RepID=UPI001C098F07|nr:YeeE/YedE family protein [Pseudoalteromonas sp. C2R02]MBU2970516.1 YeeE/YedE family protein [Pseudoalteromonas sp. C2R02]